MNDDIRRRLEDWGNSRTPEPDADFAQRTEADLRSAAYFSPSPEGPRDRRGWVLRPALVLSALVLLGGAAALFLSLRGDDDPETLAMEEVESASVTRPGGSSGPGTVGSELPDGTLIEVSPEGFAVIGGIVIPADSIAVIVDGHVELVEIGVLPDPTTTPTSTTAQTTRPTPTVAAVSPVPTAAAPTPSIEPETASASPAPTTQPTATPNTVQPQDEVTPQAATPSPQPTPTLEPTPPSPPVKVGLRSANLGPNRAELVWSAEGADQVSRWRIRARRGDSIATVAVVRASTARSLVVSRPDVGRVLYWVVAIDAEGNRLATSNEVVVTSPPARD